MNFKELQWPANSRITLLAEVLDEETLMKLIFHFMDRSEEIRKVRFPKRQTLLKVLAFYYGSKVMKGQASWEKVMKSFRAEFGMLKSIDVSRKEFKRLFRQKFKEEYKQRVKEKILKEK